MKKLILNTIHPAPYFDRLINFLDNNRWNVETWYFVDKTPEKGWKTYIPKNVHLYNELSSWKRALYFSHSDMVILAWGSKENSLLGIYLKLLGCKFAYYLDYPDPDTTKTTKFSIILKKMVFHLATYIFPASYSCANYLKTTYGLTPDKVKVFPYCHSCAPYKICDINKDREKALKEGVNPKLLIASRFIERKGYSIVYAAFKRLSDKGILNGFDIDIVGNGDLYEEYKQRFQSLLPSIRFYGWVENNVYENLLNQCDIYLHPSLFEPFGIPPLDAMERNKFVIVTDQVKSTDIFQGNDGIKIYKANDSEQLEKILLETLEHAPFLYDQTKENQKLCNKWYSMEINLNAISN